MQPREAQKKLSFGSKSLYNSTYKNDPPSADLGKIAISRPLTNRSRVAFKPRRGESSMQIDQRRSTGAVGRVRTGQNVTANRHLYPRIRTTFLRLVTLGLVLRNINQIISRALCLRRGDTDFSLSHVATLHHRTKLTQGYFCCWVLGRPLTTVAPTQTKSLKPR